VPAFLNKPSKAFLLLEEGWEFRATPAKDSEYNRGVIPFLTEWDFPGEDLYTLVLVSISILKDMHTSRIVMPKA
jgi:hypothetical protein